MNLNSNKPCVDYLEITFDSTPDRVKLARPQKVQPIVYTFMDKQIQFVLGPDYDDKLILITRKNDDYLMVSILEPDNHEHEKCNMEEVEKFARIHLNEPFKKMPSELIALLFYRMDAGLRNDNIPYGVYELNRSGSTFIFKQL